jgi:CHAD domain-containing protein
MTNIEKETPLVITDESKVVELHEVRKNTKKLRYLIELVLPKDNDGSDNVGAKNKINTPNKSMSHEILEHLEKIQKMLGDIHDYDIVIDYLNRYPSRETATYGAIRNIIRVSKKKFKEFVEYTKPLTLITNNQK